MLLMLLDEYDSPGLVVATTNLKLTLDEALFRRFDDVIEVPLPSEEEIIALLNMTLSAIDTSNNINWEQTSKKLVGYSAANIVAIAQNAAKLSVLEGKNIIGLEHIDRAISEATFKF